jgi:hypothetical protein
VAWYVPFVPLGSKIALFGASAAAWAMARWGGAHYRALAALGAALAVAATFRVGSAAAKARLSAALEGSFPALAVHDIAATPMPADPTCWEGLAVGEQGGRYVIVRASVALPPRAGADCQAGADVEPTAPFERLQRPDRDGVRLRSLYSVELPELRTLRQKDCRFRALLEFYRVPYVQRSPAAAATGHLLVGDSRYDRSPGLDFSDAELPLDPAAAPCPRFVPGWREPRAELF